ALSALCIFIQKEKGIRVRHATGVATYFMPISPLPFEFTYEGQNVELVSQSIEAKNDFQQLKITLHKNEEQIQEWKENKPIIEEIKANDKIFSLYTNKAITMTDKTMTNDNCLLGV